MFWSRQGRTYVRRYRSTTESDRKVTAGILWVILFLIGGFWLYKEIQLEEITAAVGEAEKELLQVTHYSPYNQNKLVHYTSQRVIPSDVLVDAEFQLQFPSDTIKVQRIEEYCQWIETATTHREKDDEGNTVEYTTYHYHKAWVSHPIPSVFFDQPARHHNPLNQPFPNRDWMTSSLEVGDFKIAPRVISTIRDYHNYDLSPENFASFVSSPAYREYFNYIGDGYFYSAYRENPSFSLLRGLASWAEGSLLDIQLVDFFPQCTAGDVRVHFEVVNPHHVSVIGKQLENGQIDVWTTSRGYEIGYLHSGQKQPEEIFSSEIWNVQWVVITLRVVFWMIIFGVSCFHSMIVEFPNMPTFLFSVSAYFALYSLTTLWLYSMSEMSLIGWIILIASIGLTALHFEMLFIAPPEIPKVAKMH